MREKFFPSYIPPGKESAKTIIGNDTFLPKASSHLDVIIGQVTRFNKALNNLHQIDRNIIYGSLLGVGSYLASFFCPLTLFVVGASCVASYNMAIRNPVYAEYCMALEDLILTYRWSMAKGSNIKEKLALKPIQDLIITLGPWVPNSVFTWEETGLKDTDFSPMCDRTDLDLSFIDKLRELKNGKHVLNPDYKAYGQDGSGNLFQALGFPGSVSLSLSF